MPTGAGRFDRTLTELLPRFCLACLELILTDALWIGLDCCLLAAVYGSSWRRPAPHVEVRGWPDVYVKSGSRVELQCQLSDVLDEPPFIFWYFDGQRLVDDDQVTVQPFLFLRFVRSGSICFSKPPGHEK